MIRGLVAGREVTQLEQSVPAKAAEAVDIPEAENEPKTEPQPEDAAA